MGGDEDAPLIEHEVDMSSQPSIDHPYPSDPTTTTHPYPYPNLSRPTDGAHSPPPSSAAPPLASGQTHNHNYTVSFPFNSAIVIFMSVFLFFFFINAVTSVGKIKTGVAANGVRINKALEGIKELKKEVEALRALIEQSKEPKGV